MTKGSCLGAFFFNDLNKVMRYSEITEAPIGNWTVDPDIYSNEKEMMSKWTGYEQEAKHWRDVDKKAMHSDATISKVRNAFKDVPTNFNIYFYQSTNPNYDRTLTRGRVDEKWMRSEFGDEVVDRIIASSDAQSVNFVMTNNLSDEMPISINSPWIMAHRISHTIIDGRDETGETATGWVDLIFQKLLFDLLELGYDRPINHNTGDYHWDQMIKREYTEAYGKLFGEMLGTMNSARQGHIRNYYEWIHETFAQYIITGKVTMNLKLKNLPHADDVLTKDERKLIQAKKAIWRAQSKLEKQFARILDQAKGGYWVG